MKYIFRLIIFSLLFCLKIFPQTGWYWQNPLPQGNAISSVDFISHDTGWVCGVYGTILKTVDQGKTWEVIKTNLTDPLWRISFANSLHGTAIGPEVIISTTEGGDSWIEHRFPDAILLDIERINSQAGFIVGWDSHGGGIILKTTDGGTSWTRKQSGSIESLYNISFSDSLNALIIGANKELLKTTDAGETWKKMDKLPIFSDYFCFIDTNIAIAIGEGAIIRTTDNGATWKEQFRSDKIFPSMVSFADVNNGIAAAVNTNIMLKTTDGGISWSELSTTHITNTVYIDTNLIVGTNSTPDFFISTDGGINWTSKTRGFTHHLFDICFVNPEKAFAAGTEGTIAYI